MQNANNEPMFQVTVDEAEDTEWNDILRAKGIIPEREPSPTQQLEEALEEALKKQHENRLEDKDLSDLEALEDDEDEDFLNFYKQKRIAQLKKMQEKSKFGEVFHINKPEYNDEITLASSKDESLYVLVHLSLTSKLQSRLLSNIFEIASKKYPELKFVEISANRAIENYPESNCPTLLIYHKGDVIKNLVTLLELGGNDTRLEDFESLMVKVGCVDEKDPRLLINQEDDERREEKHLKFANKKVIRSGNNSKLNLGIGKDDEDDFFD
ncbi:related to Phosducin-like protein 2 [Saccharomycodes ludwigii]|uniref:Related to Phosducin-like protein 2 n=1 Tax=Saccharomycodes ludwigii TaxID=36035 RepID=A0A376B4W6_9ASCO|nr:hypothetical protein SCDLUD_000402 [Saccharomycodes ludwigii]KAH3902811.1 hypothetical protein SCDLUD_000402 [Saccharomycodes ludwigii]SSD59735.1 related to Phosducin-like protein 2 [Saccharomycodes ludwigii]